MQTLKLSSTDIAILKHICNPANWYFGDNEWVFEYLDHSAQGQSIFMRNILGKVCDLSPTNSETHILDGRYEILRTKTNPCNFKKSGIAVLSDIKYVVNLDEVFTNTNQKTLKTAALTFYAKNPEQLEVAKKSNTPDEVKKLLCNIF